MAKAVTILYLCIHSILFLATAVVGKPNGLTLKLVHRDSPESPVNPGNLKYTERIRRLVNQSRAHEQYHNSRLMSTIHLETVRGIVHTEAMNQLLVEVGIGTFRGENPPYLSYFLLLDSGSALTWTQCEDCRAPGRHCFNQMQPLFPKSKSSSFRPIPCNSELCNAHHCGGPYCIYDMEYLDGTMSTGIIAQETFTFASNTGRAETIQIIFGCGYDQRNYPYGDGNKIAGILGMSFSGNYPSFIDQIRPQSNGRFSYCIPPRSPSGQEPTSFLQFGADIPQWPNLRSIRMQFYPGDPSYHLSLKDISLSGQRLNVPERVFARTKETTGSIIDSGSALSLIHEFAFRLLTDAMIRHFPRGSGIRITTELYGFNLCFERPASVGFAQLPNITFHFEGANIELKPESLYVLGDFAFYKYFCLTILRSHSGINILGAYQQRNHRFIYDTLNRLLHFGPEDCTPNA